jgi:hypothetical protein
MSKNWLFFLVFFVILVALSFVPAVPFSKGIDGPSTRVPVWVAYVGLLTWTFPMLSSVIIGLHIAASALLSQIVI